MEVNVISGDIAQVEADVLVNSTTGNLDLTSGPVTQSILNAGGDSLQTQCNNDYPNGIGHDEIAVTDGGDIPCSNVYHLSLPEYSGDDDDIVKTLEQIVSVCLSTAEAGGHESIAFPALGTGTLNYPADTVATCFYDTIGEFFENEQPSNLNNVIIVLNPDNDEVIQAFTNLASNYDVSSSINITVDISEEDNEGSWLTLSDTGSEDEEEEEEKVSEALEVHFVEGDITQQSVDVLVNSTTPNLNLSSGPLTKAVLQAGGDCLQKECNDKYQKGISESEIAVTTGGNLPCQYVYHTTSCQWSTDPATEQKLRDLIEKVLQQADSEGLLTVAIPALGTGVLKYPPDVVARCMFETAHNFSPNSLEQIFLVVRSNDKNVVKAYKNEMEKYSSNYNSGGTFRVSVVKGDIAQQNTEVIVNSTTPTLNLSSGPVTKAIVKAGGDNLQQECNTKYPQGIKVGEIAETSGGNLACQSVYHTTLRQWSGDKKVEQCFRELIIKCLTKAANSGKKSIAFPVLGTGTLKYPRDTVAACVFESFDQFSTDNPGTCLTEARIVVHPTDVENLKIFEDVGAARAAPYQSAIFSDMSEDFNFETAAELAGNYELPSHWSPMSEQDFVTKIQLSTMDKEYKMVARKFSAGVGTRFQIVKIERIQNKTLHVQYTMHKLRMTTENPGMQVERHLWHGTSYDAIASINVYGFSRSYTGKNATLYGEGSYFAVCPSYSAQDTYSPPTDKGLRHMYQAAVLTGHYTVGEDGMRHPPSRDAATPHIKYDTVVDNPSNPSLFVVFHDVQAYPQYLVTFK